MSFDVVGTLIDFEGGLTSCLQEIAAEANVTIDSEEALSLYRAARYSENADLFPDDLVRVYLAIAPKLGLPLDEAYGIRLRDSAKTWKAFPDSAAAMAELATKYRLIAMTNARRWASSIFQKPSAIRSTRPSPRMTPVRKSPIRRSSTRCSNSSPPMVATRRISFTWRRASITISASRARSA